MVFALNAKLQLLLSKCHVRNRLSCFLRNKTVAYVFQRLYLLFSANSQETRTKNRFALTLFDILINHKPTLATKCSWGLDFVQLLHFMLHRNTSCRSFSQANKVHLGASKILRVHLKLIYLFASKDRVH